MENSSAKTATEHDDEYPDLSDEDWAQMVRVGDFDSLDACEAFLVRRKKLARLAEDLGMRREAWEALSPNKPGLEKRFLRLLEEAVAKARALTGEAIAAE